MTRDTVPGVRCAVCGYVAALVRPRCPACRGRVEPAEFGPAGTVWSATVVHVSLPGRKAPYALAYVDLDAGPRVLAQPAGNTPLRVGQRVRIVNVTAEDEIRVQRVRPAGGADSRGGDRPLPPAESAPDSEHAGT